MSRPQRSAVLDTYGDDNGNFFADKSALTLDRDDIVSRCRHAVAKIDGVGKPVVFPAPFRQRPAKREARKD